MVQSVTLALNEPSAGNPPGVIDQATGSLLGSLVIVARHRSVHLSKEQLIREHQLKGPIVEPGLCRLTRHAPPLDARAIDREWEGQDDRDRSGTRVAWHISGI